MKEAVQAKETTKQSTDATLLAEAAQSKFFDDPQHLEAAAGYLTIANPIHEFVTTVPDIESKHQERFESHKNASQAVLRQLPINLIIGKREVHVGRNRHSINFIRGLIQLVEKTIKRTTKDEAQQIKITYDALCSGANRNTMVHQYERYLQDFLEDYDKPFDKIFYLRESRDKKAFGDNQLHQEMFSNRGEMQTYLPNSATDITAMVQDIVTYQSNHPQEHILVYLGGHGYPDGSIHFWGKDTILTKIQLQTLAKIPNITLEVDSCASIEKFRGIIPEANIFLNSEGDNAVASYDITQYMARDRYIDIDKLQSLYPAYTHVQPDMENMGFFGVLDDDPSMGMLSSFSECEMFGIGTGTQTKIGDRFDTKAAKDELLSILENGQYSEIKVKDSSGRAVNLPVRMLTALLKSCTIQAGDYNEDGQISYGETRLYAMQRYNQSFLPTMRKSDKGGYIKLAEHTPDAAKDSSSVG